MHTSKLNIQTHTIIKTQEMQQKSPTMQRRRITTGVQTVVGPLIT